MNFNKVKQDLSRVYDDLSESWGNDKTLHDWGEDDLNEFSRKVGVGGKVLDLGCASGYQSKLLARQDLNVTGLDLSRKMIFLAIKRVPEARFMVGDMTKLKFKALSFDGVYARASLLHIPKKQIPKVLLSINKILRKNGLFYLAVKEGDGEKEIVDQRHGVKVKRFFSLFKEAEIQGFLEKADFRIERTSYYKREKVSTNWIKIFARKINGY